MVLTRLLSLLLVTSTALAQAPARTVQELPATSYGTVSGHVYLSENNAPARLSNITLQPVEVMPEAKFDRDKPVSLPVTVYQTGIDGGYTLTHVTPGTYYVVVTRPGYLSPFAEFTHAELEHPTPAVQQRIDQFLPTVRVNANATAVLDIRLIRGASVSGAVRFDDGTPYATARVSLKRHEDGKWVSLRSEADQDRVDATGHWRISGLLPGEYRAQVNLSLDDRRQSSTFGPSNSSSSRDRYSLTFFSGDTTREREATSVTLADGQDLGNLDITIPVSKLHPLSGAVVDARTGRALNAGRIQLLYADDGKTVTSAQIDAATRTFSMGFVPEGEYRLLIRDAREVRLEENTSASADPFGPQPKEIVLREYAPGELPETVHGEIAGITLAVEERPAGSRLR